MASVPFKMQPLLRNILTLVVIIVFISQIDAITTLVGRYGKFRDVFSISPNNLFGSFFPARYRILNQFCASLSKDTKE